MKNLLLILILFFNLPFSNAQTYQIDRKKIKEDLDEAIADLSRGYVYFKEKKVDSDCIQTYYEKQIEKIKSEEETVLFFEYLMDEFYDSHLILNTNRKSSFRLSSPIYASIKKSGKVVVSSVWQTQIAPLAHNIIGAEIKKINGIDFNKAIDNFPTHCNDKNAIEVREWISNKLLAGRYNESRIITLKLTNKQQIELDLDKIQFNKNEGLLTSKKIDKIGFIRINNSLGRDELVNAFDQALDDLSDTEGLIIDLRNTVDGGDSYEARGIMGRFINEPKPYQKHAYTATSTNNPDIERSWVEYVSPRMTPYTKPVVVLVGRWTGSMGEGLTIGLEAVANAKILGSEMERLAGEISVYSFKHQRYAYRVPTAKIFHINGTPREQYKPTYYQQQTTNERDELLEKALQLIRN